MVGRWGWLSVDARWIGRDGLLAHSAAALPRPSDAAMPTRLSISRRFAEPTAEPGGAPVGHVDVARAEHADAPPSADGACTASARAAEGRRRMIEVICNDRLGKKIRVKCNPDDTVGDLKKLLAAQTGTRPEKLRIQKWYTVYKDHITLEDYEIHDGMGLELYYN